MAIDMKVNGWRGSKMAKGGTVSVTASKENIYCATPYSIFYYNKAENTVNRFTRIVSVCMCIAVRIITYEPHAMPSSDAMKD